MTGEAVALDTNAAIAILRGERSAVNAIQAFATVCLPVAVIGELRYGALNSGRREQNLAGVEELVSRCRVLALDQQTATTYADTRALLKTRGTPIPENDVWISAACLQHGMPLLTRDSHFEHVAGLRIVRF